jgi:hypothetical protein
MILCRGVQKDAGLSICQRWVVLTKDDGNPVNCFIHITPEAIDYLSSAISDIKRGRKNVGFEPYDAMDVF